MYQRLVVTHKMHESRITLTDGKHPLMALVMKNTRTGSYHVVDIRNHFVCAEYKTEAKFNAYKRQKTRKGIKFEPVS